MGTKEGMGGIWREECPDRKGQRNWACRAALPCSTSPAVVPAAAATAAAATVTEAGAVDCLLPTNTHTRPYPPAHTQPQTE